MKTRYKVAAAAFIIAVLAACQPSPPAPTTGTWVNDPNGPGEKVAVLGDSQITQNLSLWTTGALAGDGPLAIWAVAGSQYSDSGAWGKNLSPDPDVALIAQGANNAYPLFGLDGWTRDDELDLWRLVNYLRQGGVTCILVSTIGYPATAPLPQRQHADIASAFIRSWAAQADNPDVWVWDWQAESQGQPWFGGNQLHVNPAGAAAHAASGRAAVQGCP